MNFYLKCLFWISLIGIFLASFLPQLFPANWLADLFSHFKLQYIFLLLILFAVSFYIQKWHFSILIILFLLAWNSWFVLPLYFAPPTPFADSTESISILSINLLASNTQYAQTLDLIHKKDPDILVLLELSPLWKNEMKPLLEKYPHRLMNEQMNNFGIGLLSKIPITVSLHDFEKDLPASILGKFQVKDQSIYILTTHPVPPVNGQMFRMRNLQLEEIAELSQLLKHHFIVIGDLNTSSYSVHFQNLLSEGKLTDSRKGIGILPSWPANFFPLQTTLDHCLITEDLHVINRSTLSDIGSDHLPIWIEIGI